MTPRLAVAVTAWRESRRAGFSWIRECLAAPAAHPAVGDVVVYDDGSDDADQLEAALADMAPRVRLVRGERNLGVFGAKLASVEAARGDWVLMADSDNIFGPDALGMLVGLSSWAPVSPEPTDLLCPGFGRPALDYRHLAGDGVRRWRLADFPDLAGARMSGCLLNTGNQTVPRERFLEVLAPYRGEAFVASQPDFFPGRLADPLIRRRVYDSADSYFINRCWLLSGGALAVVRGLEYIHGSLTPEHQAMVRSSWEQAPPEKDELPAHYERELRGAAGIL